MSLGENIKELYTISEDQRKNRRSTVPFQGESSQEASISESAFSSDEE